MKKAALLVSLDFEMFWGVRDLYTLEARKDNLMQVRSAVSRILELFERYEVHATWATVGLLFTRSRKEMMAAIPEIRPSYAQARLSPYPELETVGENEQGDPFHYGSSMIRKIRDTPHQEIGTHTFSHYYCLEDGQTETQFRADLETAIDLAAKWDIDLRSLVFPRNQVNDAYLGTLRQLGIQSYRGASSHWIYRPRKREAENQFRRALRLIDAFVNLSGHHTLSYDELRQGPPFNFAASRLLREFNPSLGIFEPLRMRRICSGLDYAAKTGRVYHLWCHPEELASNQDRNMAALKTVLERFARLRDRGQMESFTMAELSHRMLDSESADEREHELVASHMTGSPGLR